MINNSASSMANTNSDLYNKIVNILSVLNRDEKLDKLIIKELDDLLQAYA